MKPETRKKLIHLRDLASEIANELRDIEGAYRDASDNAATEELEERYRDAADSIESLADSADDVHDGIDNLMDELA